VIEDHFLPVYDVSDGVATVVKADAARTWAALMEVDLIELGRRRPLIGMLGALRIAPELVGHLLRGEPPAKPPKTIRLRDMTTLPTSGGGWVLLAERPPEAIALGLVGKFWKPVIEFAEVTGDDFRDFSEPGYAKTVYALSVKPLDNGSGTLLSAVMRTATTDEHARRWFRRYWTLGVGSGAHLLARGLIDAAREDATVPRRPRRSGRSRRPAQ
jgi:hypothetical protein